MFLDSDLYKISNDFDNHDISNDFQLWKQYILVYTFAVGQVVLGRFLSIMAVHARAPERLKKFVAIVIRPLPFSLEKNVFVVS